MTAWAASSSVELVPAIPQGLWRWPAVVNFAAGGLGAGLYLGAALAAGFGPSPAVEVASWLGPALVGLGFAAVAAESGRPLRGLRVLSRVGTSWMSRELWLGAAFVVLALGEAAWDTGYRRALAALAAAGLVLAQGLILRAVAIMPVVFLTSALVAGGGLLLLLAVGRAPVGPPLLGLAQVCLTLHLGVWCTYGRWSEDPAFVAGVQSLRRDRGALVHVGLGYLVPSLGLGLALALPAAALPMVVVAGGAMVLSQGYAKAALILTAGQVRPITLPLRPRGRPS
jgi:hypothetical protein